MNTRVPLCLATLSIVLTACEPTVVSSRGLELEDLQASFGVDEIDGLAVAHASFRDGDETTPIVRLRGSDWAWVDTADGPVALEEEWTDAEWPRYEWGVEVGDGPETLTFGAEFGGRSAEFNSVELPPAFTLLEPAAGETFLAEDGITVSWFAEPYEGSGWYLDVDGPCIRGFSHHYPSYTTSTGALERDGSPTTCDVTVLVRRTMNEGEIDPAFRDSSRVRATRDRTATVRVTTE